MTQGQLKVKEQALKRRRNMAMKMLVQIQALEKLVLTENRWDTWHVGGVREHLSLHAINK